MRDGVSELLVYVEESESEEDEFFNEDSCESGLEGNIVFVVEIDDGVGKVGV